MASEWEVLSDAESVDSTASSFLAVSAADLLSGTSRPGMRANVHDAAPNPTELQSQDSTSSVGIAGISVAEPELSDIQTGSELQTTDNDTFYSGSESDLDSVGSIGTPRASSTVLSAGATLRRPLYSRTPPPRGIVSLSEEAPHRNLKVRSRRKQRRWNNDRMLGVVPSDASAGTPALGSGNGTEPGVSDQTPGFRGLWGQIGIFPIPEYTSAFEDILSNEEARDAFARGYCRQRPRKGKSGSRHHYRRHQRTAAATTSRLQSLHLGTVDTETETETEVDFFY